MKTEANIPWKKNSTYKEKYSVYDKKTFDIIRNNLTRDAAIKLASKNKNYEYGSAAWVEDNYKKKHKNENKLDLRKMIREELLKETGIIKTANNIAGDLQKFLTGVVIPKSKGYVNNERDAAILLSDILKHKYNF